MLYPYQRDELEQLPSPQPARWQAANLCSCTAAQPHKNNIHDIYFRKMMSHYIQVWNIYRTKHIKHIILQMWGSISVVYRLDEQKQVPQIVP
jgi:hypothetical protein